MSVAVGFDPRELEAKVQAMYTDVALNPEGDFHFEMGRGLAERLGYPSADLDRIPAESVQSFAGVGYYFDLADLRPGDTVLDLGSGSGMDVFVAALTVGPGGRVIGIDMTEAQRRKAQGLARRDGFRNVEIRAGYIEELPVPDASVDVVISNGVFNLAPDKLRVFQEAARVLRPGGRLAFADIVTEVPLPESVVCNATLWAACIGGAAQTDAYRVLIEAAGFDVVAFRDNRGYGFISERAQSASRKYGVKSVSVLAVRR